MKPAIKTLSLLFVLFSLFFAACPGPNTDKGEGTFTISLSESIRAAYPANTPGHPNPGAPTLDELRFDVTFTEVGSSRTQTFSFNGNEEIKGSIAAGDYTVSVDIFLLADDSLYAQGTAVDNPVTIKSGSNNPSIKVQLYGSYKVWVSKDSGPDVLYVNLKAAFDSITSAGDYVVKIGTNQALAPYTFAGAGVRDVTLIAESNPVEVHLSSTGSLFTVTNNVNLTLDSGITLKGRSGNDASVIQVSTGGNLTMESGSGITGNATTFWGGAVTVSTGGTFNMEAGAKIFGNAAGNGGGVCIMYGTFIMNGGEICDNAIGGNTRYYLYSESYISPLPFEIGLDLYDLLVGYMGGGVLIMKGNFIMHDGKISGNVPLAGSDVSRGGGVASVTGSSFIMEGGEISGNKATWGGGVVLFDGTFTMKTGAKIAENIAQISGGGIEVYHGTHIMEDGEIFGNKTTGMYYDGTNIHGRGGGVSLWGGTFTMQDGEIYENETDSGGGVIVNGGIFTMENGEIFGNIANGPNLVYFRGGVGGGVALFDGRFSMEGGQIYRNIAANSGGGVNVLSINYDTISTFSKASTGGIITGYDDDPTNGNVVKDASNVIKPNSGHAVWVNDNSSKRDATVIATEPLGWDGATSIATGTWDP